MQPWQCQMQEHNLVALPLQLGKKGAGRMCTLRVLRRFEFDPALMRSAVLAVDFEDPDRGLFFMRGAPSVVEQLARGGHVPSDYRQASFVLQLTKPQLCCNCVCRDQSGRLQDFQLTCVCWSSCNPSTSAVVSPALSEVPCCGLCG